MKIIIIFTIAVLTILFSTYYYWNNRYVKLYPVKMEEDKYIIKTNDNLVFHVKKNENTDYSLFGINFIQLLLCLLFFSFAVKEKSK